MPPLIDALILAVVQGLTEFLPVSSSGHLVLLQHVFGAQQGDLFLDVVLHCGTLGSVLVVYRRELLRLLRFDRPALQYILALAVGTVPAVIVGFLFKNQIERLFDAPLLVSVALVVTGLVLLSTRAARTHQAELAEPWQPQAPSVGKALLVGCAQAVAICPGISRSGSTIAASLWLGLARAEAARFSFLLAIPAIAGAAVLQVFEGNLTTRVGAGGLAAAALAAFLVGLVAIRMTALAVVQRHFWKFALYCLPLGAVVILVVLLT